MSTVFLGYHIQNQPAGSHKSSDSLNQGLGAPYPPKNRKLPPHSLDPTPSYRPIHQIVSPLESVCQLPPPPPL